MTQFPPGSRPIDRACWGATCPGRGSPGAAGAGLGGPGGPGGSGVGVPGANWGCGEPSPARPLGRSATLFLLLADFATFPSQFHSRAHNAPRLKGAARDQGSWGGVRGGAGTPTSALSTPPGRTLPRREAQKKGQIPPPQNEGMGCAGWGVARFWGALDGPPMIWGWECTVGGLSLEEEGSSFFALLTHLTHPGFFSRSFYLLFYLLRDLGGHSRDALKDAFPPKSY